MKTCGKCGRNVDSGMKFCPACGAVFENERKRRKQAFDPVDIQNNKVMAVFAYRGILVLIPMLAARESKFARYHARQELALLMVEMMFAVSYCILSLIVLSISWRLYFIVKIMGMAGFLFPVLAVIGIMNVIGGKARRLPLIGNIV